ncbi:PREDICTED: mitochondrial import inner membrane translocase subunit TIM50-A-like [Nicrophorus vespilloides]|uniref:Mitochondrial import inner membrane translocase subunit TIM50 n=1 Tax=Nicrophorus vespilloides TaxID=110193 RepID=A0ABM1MRP8_NICVS|nr:PREDICTED: mitochondrial import inner membrane translocase subunit TIM50-A-like [Nicrophorus vespilloides]
MNTAVAVKGNNQSPPKLPTLDKDVKFKKFPHRPALYEKQHANQIKVDKDLNVKTREVLAVKQRLDPKFAIVGKPYSLKQTASSSRLYTKVPTLELAQEQSQEEQPQRQQQDVVVKEELDSKPEEFIKLDQTERIQVEEEVAAKSEETVVAEQILQNINEKQEGEALQDAAARLESAEMAASEANIIGSLTDRELEQDQEQGDKDSDSKDGGWRAVKYSIAFMVTAVSCTLGYLLAAFGRPKYDFDGNAIPDKYSNLPIYKQYILRASDEIKYYNRLIKEPSRDKLLPDVLKPPYYQPPYTLVMEFTDVLVHPEWTYSTGWRFKKRPGLDQFLELLCSRFELVVYTAEMGMTVFPIVEALDKNNLISYKLVRDATNFVDGHHVKDLDKLNRDLSKVIVVDWNPESAKFHGENLFKIGRWNGNDDDTTLLDLTSFLIAISEWEIEDVRSVLKYYSGFKNPLAIFKERQQQIYSAQ